MVQVSIKVQVQLKVILFKQIQIYYPTSIAPTIWWKARHIIAKAKVIWIWSGRSVWHETNASHW